MLLVRAAHNDLLQTARSAGTNALVGPTDERGWTTVHADAEHDLARRFAEWLIEDPDEAGLQLRIGTAQHTLSWLWRDHAEVPDVTGDVRAIARVLAETFGEGHEVERVVDRLMVPATDRDWLLPALGLRLPELEDLGPAVALVAVRAPESDVRIAAAIAGPARILDAGDGWWLAAAEAAHQSEDHLPSWELARAAADMTSRRAPVLYVGRRDAARTVLLMTRSEHVPVAGWDLRWESSTDSSSDRYAALAARLGEAEVPAHARALLRRRSAPDGVATLCAMFGVPTAVAEILENPGVLTSGELVQRSSPGRAWWTAVREAARVEEAQPRGVTVRRLTVAVLGVLLEAVVVAYFVAMALTDGHLTGEGPLDRSDWWFIVIVTPIALASLVWCALVARRAIRGLRASRGGESQSG